MEAFDYIVAIKRPISELAELLEGTDERNRAIFNKRIGGTYYESLAHSFTAQMMYDDEPQWRPFLYCACYGAMQIGAAVDELITDDEMALAKINEIRAACARLINDFEGKADELYDRDKPVKA